MFLIIFVCYFYVLIILLDRPINQKIISTDAGNGFGWTRRSNFSSKEWDIYYLKRAPNPDLL
jgi:hypothetical protein